MSPLVFGLLCALPLAVLFSFRLGRLGPRMDGKARRTFLLKGVMFTVSCAGVSGALYAQRGTQPLPLPWVLLLAATAAIILLGWLKRT